MTTRTLLTPTTNAMDIVRNEIDRLFDRAMTPSLGAMLPHSRFFDAMRTNPLVNVIERDDTIVIEAEMPGISKNDLKVSITDRILTIEGQHAVNTPEDADTICCERPTVRFERSMRLPAGISDEAVDASLGNGILTIVLPKSQQSCTRQVDITAR